MKLRMLGIAVGVCSIVLTAPATAADSGAPAVSQPATTGQDWIDTRPAPASGAAQPPAPATSSFAGPKSLPAAPAAAPVVANSANVAGQWVYTQQYGWVWLAYDRAYTYVAPEGYPYSYVYYPDAGWCWLYAPWVLGWGPVPYWGVYGPVHFAWYAHPWFARPIIRGPVVHGGVWMGGHWRGTYWGGGRAPAFRGGRGHR